MEEILEIRDIMNRLNPKEKNAARKYFSRHYQNTKELQLLNLIDSFDGEKRINIENRICKLGYESIQSKSFQKLRTRLRDKLYDYLSTSVSINELRQIDSHSFLKYRMKKAILQSGIFIEKGFLNQANDLLRSILRLAQENEQFQEVVVILEKLRHIQEVQGQISECEKISEKINYFQSIQDKLSHLEFVFKRIVSQIDIQGMDHINVKILDLKKELQNETSLMGYERIQLMLEYLYILICISENETYRAWNLTINRLKSLQFDSMKHEVQIKFFYYNTMTELLYVNNHPAWAQYFIHHEAIKSKPDHLKFRLRYLENFNLLNRGKNKGIPSLLQHNWSEGKEELLNYYLQAHQNFKAGYFKKSSELIDEHIRKFPINSLQQLDLMVLQLLCHFEMQHYDLLDYRLQSYLKNLAYRSKYDVPVYYHLIYKVLHLIIRTKRKADKRKIQEMLNELNINQSNTLQKLRSFQPGIFIEWLLEKFELQPAHEDALLNQEIITSLPMKNVA